jgi:hypothetical protein
MRAYIEGCAALKEADSTITILTTDPLVNMVPPLYASHEQIKRAATLHEYQFQAVDILSGIMSPELGGSPEYLDIVGFNYYYNNQWIADTYEFLPWVNLPADPRWRSLGSLLADAHNRYNRPVAITETSHPGIHRPDWIRYVAGECANAIKNGLPLWGICLYPILDRPDWDHFSTWHESGLWDAFYKNEKHPNRILYQPYAEAIWEAQELIGAAMQMSHLVVNQ